MEEKKLHLDAPFLSVRRENSNEPNNTKKKTTTKRKVKDSCQETEQETLVRLLQNNDSFKESDLIKALGMVSSTTSFGVHDEFKKNRERLSNLARDNTVLQNRDLIMAIAMKQKKESSLTEEDKKKKKRNIALQRVSMAIKQDLQNVDDDYEDHHVNSNVSKKALFGLCSKNSVDVLIPILSRDKACKNHGVKPEKMVNQKSLSSVNKAKSSSPRILGSNQVMTKFQEHYPKQRFATEISKISLPTPSEIPQHSSRLQRARSTNQIQRRETRFLAEEVKRRRNMNKIRSGNLYKTSQISVSQLPWPKTPSESWLCRTLPRTSVVSSQTTVLKKLMDQKTNPKSIKWETIVKTSYKHHDYLRYLEELDVVHPSPQSKS